MACPRFARAEFARAEFARAEFARAEFARAEFARAEFARAEFAQAEFAQAEFAQAGRRGAQFPGIRFRGADAHPGRVRPCGADRAVPVCPTPRRDQGPGPALAVAEPDQQRPAAVGGRPGASPCR
ncbi:MAG: pentapeptide repeat-containing protein [Streptosporangiaceae bacterium]